MSVIGNALKAAQREKQKKTGSSGGPPPILVPLRPKAGAASGGFSWRNALTFAAGFAVVFVVTAYAVKLVRGRPQVGPAPAPIILGDAAPAASDSAQPKRDTVRPTPPAASVVSSALSPTAPRAKQGARSSPRDLRAPIAERTAEPRQASQSTAPARSERAERADASSGLRISVEAQREDASRLFAAAVAAHREGNFAYARTSYERVLTMAPGDVDAMNNLALLMLANREYDGAERLLRRAVSLAPRNAGVWSNLGTVLRERGQSADAIAAFQHALSIDPSHQASRIALAQQFLAIGSLPQAREILDRVVAENPAIPEAQYALGQVLEQQGDVAGAIRAYSTFLRVAPPRFATHAEFVRRRISELSARR